VVSRPLQTCHLGLMPTPIVIWARRTPTSPHKLGLTPLSQGHLYIARRLGFHRLLFSIRSCEAGIPPSPPPPSHPMGDAPPRRSSARLISDRLCRRSAYTQQPRPDLTEVTPPPPPGRVMHHHQSTTLMLRFEVLKIRRPMTSGVMNPRKGRLRHHNFQMSVLSIFHFIFALV
jgi:hypothetical protein